MPPPHLTGGGTKAREWGASAVRGLSAPRDVASPHRWGVRSRGRALPWAGSCSALALKLFRPPRVSTSGPGGSWPGVREGRAGRGRRERGAQRDTRAKVQALERMRVGGLGGPWCQNGLGDRWGEGDTAPSQDPAAAGSRASPTLAPSSHRAECWDPYTLRPAVSDPLGGSRSGLSFPSHLPGKGGSAWPT